MIRKLEIGSNETMDKEQFKILKKIIEDCHFMQKKREDLDLIDQDLLEFCKNMTYEYVEAGDSIYDRGDEINKIYYILKGKVSATYPYKTNKELQELELAKKEDLMSQTKTIKFGAAGDRLVPGTTKSDLKSQNTDRSRGSYRSRASFVSKRSSRSRASRKRGKTFVTDVDTLTGKNFQKPNLARTQCEELKEMLDDLIIEEHTDCRNKKTNEHIENSINRTNCIDKIEDEYDTKMKNDEYRQKKWPTETDMLIQSLLNVKVQQQTKSAKKRSKFDKGKTIRSGSKILLGDYSEKKNSRRATEEKSQKSISRQNVRQEQNVMQIHLGA